MLGVLAELPRKSYWTIAELAGMPPRTEYGTCWSGHAVRDDVCGYIVGQLGDPDAALVVDETGDVKKGTAGTHGP